MEYWLIFESLLDDYEDVTDTTVGVFVGTEEEVKKYVNERNKSNSKSYYSYYITERLN